MASRRRPSRARRHLTPLLEPLEDRLVLSVLGGTRPIDGRGNNVANPSLGQAGTPLIRTAPVGYADGLSTPRGGDPSTLPSARAISNAVHAQSGPLPSAAGLTGWVFQWGQFIDHDIGLSQPAPPGPGQGGNEPFNIPVPTGDPQFDPFSTGTQVIPLQRSLGQQPAGGVRDPINTITAFLDGSMIYGSDEVRARNLRTGVSGRLRTSAGPDGALLPFNTFGEENANQLGADPTTLFLSGDVRVNEQAGLTTIHTLFVREHNRIAAGIAAANPGLSDEEIYQQARAIVIPEIQAITYNEFLPAVLGPDALLAYTGYKPSVNPQLANEFSTAGYRVGHTMLPAELLRLGPDGNPIAQGNLPLRDAFFNPDNITGVGIEPYLRGLAGQTEEEIDRFVIDDVRNFLFGPPGAGGFDLTALNIQRGRDHGLPSYNQVRRAYGLAPATRFADISSDPATQAALARVYASVDDVDVWTGGLCEDKVPGSQLGELFRTVWVDQFTRLRDGDRFWYERIFSGPELDAINATTLADVIRRNTGITNIQDNVFGAPPVLFTSAHVVGQPSTDGVGSFDPATGTWYVRMTSDTGPPDRPPFAFGMPGWAPVGGDWDGDGRASVGVVDDTGMTFPGVLAWYLDGGTGSAPEPFAYGMDTWAPVVGDWDGDMRDTVGAVDGTGSVSPFAVWYLRNKNSPGAADLIYVFGLPGWVPVAGDWDGDGHDTPGMFDPATGTWYLRGSNRPDDPAVTVFAFGAPGWRPVVGDWDGDGIDTVGVVDPSGQWFLRNSNDAGAADGGQFFYGLGEWTPLCTDLDAQTLAGGNPVLLKNGLVADLDPPDALSPADLTAAFNGLLARLRREGVPAALTDAFAALDVFLVPLPGWALAATDPATGAIYLDPFAAGRGYFVDPSPLDDAEFTGANGLANGPANEGQVDLLTVLARQLAVAGGSEDTRGLLAGTLGTGERRLDHLDVVFGDL